MVIASLAIIVSQVAFAQTTTTKASVVWGPEHKTSKKETLGHVIGSDETGTYAIKTKIRRQTGPTSALTLEHYNPDMSLSKAVELELVESGKERDLEFTMYIADNLLVFSSFKNQKLKKNFLFYQTVNKKTLQLNNDLTKIGEIDYSGHSKYNPGRFNYELSNDSSKVLIHYNLPYDKGSPARFGLLICDDQFNLLWKKEATVPHLEKFFFIEDYEIDNEGNVYLLAYASHDRAKYSKGPDALENYVVFNYQQENEDATEFKIDVDEKFPIDLKIGVNNDLDLICGGFYSLESFNGVKGSFFLKIDGRTKEIISKNFQEFEIDFITQNMSERQEKKAKKKADKGKNLELFEYDLDHLILKDDGGATLIGEQYFSKTTQSTMTTSTGTTTSSTTRYYFNDILVINMNADGSLEWPRKIAKQQRSTNDGGFFSSYSLAVVKDKLHFVFNDNPVNLFYKGEGSPETWYKGKEALVVLVTMDQDGVQEREALFKDYNSKTITRPIVGKQISPKELILFGQQKKSSRLAKVTFKD